MEERIYTIPLRQAFRVPRSRRAKKAVKIVREFLKRHMKVEEVVIGESINNYIWNKGLKKPPRRVRVHALIHDGKVYTELLGVDIKLPEKKEEKKKEEVSKKAEEEKVEEPRKEEEMKPEKRETKEEQTESKKEDKEEAVEEKEQKNESNEDREEEKKSE